MLFTRDRPLLWNVRQTVYIDVELRHCPLQLADEKLVINILHFSNETSKEVALKIIK